MTETVQTIKQQLQQLRAQHASGALGDVKYAEKRAPLERKLADLVIGGADSPAEVKASTSARPSLALWASLGVIAILVAAAGYWWTSSPQRGDQMELGSPAAASGEEAAASAPHSLDKEQFGAMADRLAERLKEQPDDATGWGILGRSYMALGRIDESLAAFGRAAELRPDDAAALADLADALAVKNDRNLDGDPTRLIERALKLEPDNLKALTLAGTAAFNRRDFAAAAQYFDRAVKVGPPDSQIVQQARSAAAEARELGNLPAGAADQKAAATDSGSQKTAGATAGGGVTGTVSLAPALASKVSAEDTVFIFARPAEGSRAPLAIIRKQVKDLPFAFRLDDSLAMSPAALVSTAGRVVVGARVTKSGQAMPQPGDLEGATGAIAVGSNDVSVVIAKEVK